MRKYILNKDHSVSEASLNEWSTFFESGDRKVAVTKIGEALASTVFLGIDHSFGAGPPLLFETMVFDESGEEEYMNRYSTWDEAIAGHEEAVRIAREKRPWDEFWKTQE